MKKLFFLLLLFSVTGSNISQAQETKSLDLKACLSICFENNAQVLKAQYDIEKSRQKSNEIRSNLFPKISAIGGYAYNIDPTLHISTERLQNALPSQVLPYLNIPDYYDWKINGIENMLVASANATWVLYNQSIYTGMALQKKLTELYTIGYEKTKEEVAFELGKLYFLIQTTSRQIEIVDDNVKRLDKLFEISEAAHGAGLLMPMDLNRISVKRENLKVKQNQVENIYAYQQNMLKYLLGFPDETEVVLTDSAEMDLLANYTLSPSDVNNGSDIRILEKKQEAAEKNIRFSRTGYIPSLAFVGGVLTGNFQENFDRLFNTKYQTFGVVGVMLSIPIFDGLEKRAKTNQAKIEAKQLELELNDTKERLRILYTNTQSNYNSSYEDLQACRQNLDLAEEIYDNTLLKYNQGLTSLSDLLQTEAEMSEAQSTYIQVLYQCKEAELSLLKLSGKLLGICE